MKNKKSSFKITKRHVQITLGLLWLLDGALQLQHQMFTSSFATQVIVPAAAGQPRVVNGAMHFWLHLFLLHPAICNTLVVLIQLSIGGLILWRRTSRVGLLLSAFWGLFIWYIGEGLGGLLGGQTSLLMGAPGAGILYVILALAVLPPKNEPASNEHSFPATWLVFAWALLWVGGAAYQLLPAQRSTAGLGGMITGNASGAPGWLAAIDIHVGNAVSGIAAPGSQGTGYWLILLFAIIQVLIGIGVFSQRSTRLVAIYAGIGLSIVFWVIGQSLGGYYTGLATDLNTAPLFVLLGIAIIGHARLDRELPKLYAKLEKLMI